MTPNPNRPPQFDPELNKRRVSSLTVFCFLAAIALIAKLSYLQIFKSAQFSVLAESQHLQKWEVPARRGTIFLRDGSGKAPVAMNETVQLFYIDPTFIKDKNKFARAVAPIVTMSEKELLAKANEKSEYVVIKKEVSKEQAEALSKLEMPGLILKNVHKRTYPEGALMAHALGFVNSDGQGEYGIEQYLNKELSGTAGQVRAKVDKLGVPILNLDNVIKNPVPGSAVELTVDKNIQSKIEATLEDAVKRFKADSGTIIVMEPKSGRILGLANMPEFDPNKYFEQKDYTVFENTAYSRVYEPGSVSKIFTMAAGLDQKVITPQSTYTDTGQKKVDEHTIKNSDLKSHGVQTMTQVLAQSLNTGTTWVLEQLGGGKITDTGEKRFYDYLTKFGFGSKTEVETNLEAFGFVPKPKSVANHTYATMTFGQSLAVTPIQLAQAVSAIANGGAVMKPYMVEKVISPEGQIKETKPAEVRRVINRETAAQLKAMMVAVVEIGHGKRAGVAGYNVAGKTGTAQIAKPGGGYYEKANVGSFVGFAPAEDPKFVIIVKIDRPHVAWAESSAAPVFSEVAQYLFRYMQIPPSR